MHVVSGIRPTGRIHLGNYLGAIREWRKYPDGKFFVADLHSITGDSSLTQRQLAALGINAVIESDYMDTILGIQHLISQYVGVGRLERMTQYKDKSETEQATLQLLAYPVLMTADILCFKGTHVPVGADQLQHLEFARDVVDILKHNRHEDFLKPEAILSDYPKIMSLSDGTKKMSKSDSDLDGTIFVDDSKDEIARKIKIAKTGVDMNDCAPSLNNLKTVYKALGGVNNHEKFKDFKEELTSLLIAEFLR